MKYDNDRIAEYLNGSPNPLNPSLARHLVGSDWTSFPVSVNRTRFGNPPQREVDMLLDEDGDISESKLFQVEGSHPSIHLHDLPGMVWRLLKQAPVPEIEGEKSESMKWRYVSSYVTRDATHRPRAELMNGTVMIIQTVLTDSDNLQPVQTMDFVVRFGFPQDLNLTEATLQELHRIWEDGWNRICGISGIEAVEKSPVMPSVGD